MEDLDSRWIQVSRTKCPEKDASAATLGLTNMAGQQPTLTQRPHVTTGNTRCHVMMFSCFVHVY